MTRPGLLLVSAVAFQLAACGPATPDPAKAAARSFSAQAALFCPNDGFSWDAFGTMASQLGAAPDVGTVRRPATVRESEVVRERWVALNHLGHRTTAWIAELGPGRQYRPGIPEPVEHVSGLVCAVHDPQIGRGEAFALTRKWEGGQITSMARSDTPSPSDVLGKTWINSVPGLGFYQDLELRIDDVQASDGAMLIRRRFIYGG